MEELKVGYAREDFSPDKPVRMNSTKTGTTVTDPICATAMSFSQDGKRVLVIAMDVRNVYAHFTEVVAPMVAEATGVKEQDIIFHTPHNHSSPDCSAANDPTVLDWRDRIGAPAIVRAAQKAVADEKTVTAMSGGIAETENLSFVRRYMREDGSWTGISSSNPSREPIIAHESQPDPEMRVVKLERAGGKDILLVSYQVHAAGALGSNPTEVNADFVGPLRDRLEEATGSHMIYLQGACGNLNYGSRVKAEKPVVPVDYREEGVKLAVVAQQALANAKPMKLGKLCWRIGGVECHINHTRDHLVPDALRFYEEEDPEKRKQILRESGIPSRFVCGTTIRCSQKPQTETMELASIGFGDLVMGFYPVEMFDFNGVQLREASPFAMTFPCGYSLNYRGYMPCHQFFPHGEYEVDMCNYLPGTGENIVLGLLKQINQVYKEING